MPKKTYIANGIKFNSLAEVEKYAKDNGFWISAVDGERKRNGDMISKVTLSKL